MHQAIRALLLTLGLTVSLGAQSKAPLPPTEYGQFETLATIANHGGLSPDGKWLAYGINRANRSNELRLVNVATRATTVAAFGPQPGFTADLHLVAYSIWVPEAQHGK